MLYPSRVLRVQIASLPSKLCRAAGLVPENLFTEIYLAEYCLLLLRNIVEVKTLKSYHSVFSAMQFYQ